MQQQNSHDETSARGARQKPLLAWMITGSVIVSLLLVILSMWLYNLSGAAQLDLSRPGYQDVRAKAQQSQPFEGFDSTGALDSTSLDAFENLYRKQQQDINQKDKRFDAASLDDAHLEIHVE